MKRSLINWLLLWASLLAFFAALFVFPARADAIEEPRFCGPPARNDRGEIIRRADVLRAFERIHLKPGPGWYRDHVIPLACGGCDSVGNLQWLPEAAWRDKSRWERKIYGGRGISKGCP